jgi:thioredoxin-like negative regulator of GroEL
MKKIIRFTASWCVPCKSLAKVLEEVDLGVPVEVVDIDDNMELAMEYGIRSVPTLKLVEDGTVLKTLNGVKTATELLEWVNE